MNPVKAQPYTVTVCLAESQTAGEFVKSPEAAALGLRRWEHDGKVRRLQTNYTHTRAELDGQLCRTFLIPLPDPSMTMGELQKRCKAVADAWPTVAIFLNLGGNAHQINLD